MLAEHWQWHRASGRRLPTEPAATKLGGSCNIPGRCPCKHLAAYHEIIWHFKTRLANTVVVIQEPHGAGPALLSTVHMDERGMQCMLRRGVSLHRCRRRMRPKLCQTCACRSGPSSDHCRDHPCQAQGTQSALLSWQAVEASSACLCLWVKKRLRVG